jgi:transketolase
VPEVVVENLPIPMERIGVCDTFAESGAFLEIIDNYGPTAPHIATAVPRVVARKG